jgi:hypothetical protein
VLNAITYSNRHLTTAEFLTLSAVSVKHFNAAVCERSDDRGVCLGNVADK